MKTITVNGISYTGFQPNGMSDLQFVSMLLRNDMRTEKMVKLIGGLK